jgi:hypothetical protein
MAWKLSKSCAMSSARQAVMRGPSFTGLGNRPCLTPSHQLDLLTGSGPLGARIWARRTNRGPSRSVESAGRCGPARPSGGNVFPNIIQLDLRAPPRMALDYGDVNTPSPPNSWKIKDFWDTCTSGVFQLGKSKGKFRRTNHRLESSKNFVDCLVGNARQGFGLDRPLSCCRAGLGVPFGNSES